MRIAVGAPANGTDLKEALRARLEEDGRVEGVVDVSDPDDAGEPGTYPAVSLAAARLVADGEVDRALLVCGTGVGTAIVASKVDGVRAATAHDLVTARGAVENYDAQVLCMGQNVIAAPAAWALVDQWLDARHDPAGSYAPKLAEIARYEAERAAAAAGGRGRVGE